ncbi:MAG TPA: class I SAM-dependent methyltransferase, partial [Anaerolineales bacterium]|nr:class I SAM-dependent methyltransferase [Anaerolineales bacterium]
DPAGAEIQALKRMTNWRGKRVLEVGCGGGRLTLRLAGLGAGQIIAFDPDEESIRAARKELPEKYKGRIIYQVGNAEHVKQKANQFDIVVFSWVL